MSTDSPIDLDSAVQDTSLRLHSDEGIDLHLHTYASDGFWDPTILVNYLADHGVRVAAVCDHDTQDSVVEAVDAGARRGVLMIPGTEVTVRWGERQWHLLVYGIRPDDPRAEAKAFLDLMGEQDARFVALAVDARRRVEASGRPLPSITCEINGRTMKPVHVLRAMIADKHVPRLKEAAELVVELGGHFTTDSRLEDVVGAAHQAGGICILAHPGRADLGPALNAEVLDQMLADAPLDGIEAHYRSYTDDDTAFYRGLAEDRGLLIGAGSDSHAPGAPVDPRPWRAIWAADLLGRLGITVEPVSDGPIWEHGMDQLAVKPEPAKEPAAIEA